MTREERVRQLAAVYDAVYSDDSLKIDDGQRFYHAIEAVADYAVQYGEELGYTPAWRAELTALTLRVDNNARITVAALEGILARISNMEIIDLTPQYEN